MSGSKRILIVEDEDTIREVPDGYTALDLIAEAEPDLG